MEAGQGFDPIRHDSYSQHRRQWWWHIVLPVLAVALILIGALAGILLATFGQDGEVHRWAAVATMWLLAPLLLIGLLKFLVLIGLIYGMARLLAILPGYTGQTQNWLQRMEQRMKRGADAAVRPVLALEGLVASLRRVFRGR